jgi:hypothetical protein
MFASALADKPRYRAGPVSETERPGCALVHYVQSVILLAQRTRNTSAPFPLQRCVVSTFGIPLLGSISGQHAAIGTTHGMLVAQCHGRKTAFNTTMQPAALLYAFSSSWPPCCRCCQWRFDRRNATCITVAKICMSRTLMALLVHSLSYTVGRERVWRFARGLPWKGASAGRRRRRITAGRDNPAGRGANCGAGEVDKEWARAEEAAADGSEAARAESSRAGACMPGLCILHACRCTRAC